jgi:hypothetical protein
MPTFTVHAAPPRLGAGDPDRFAFVRDGFYFWAFLLAPLWLLVHRLWLALLGYIVIVGLCGVSFALTGAPGPAKFIAGFMLALLVGFEAGTLWRWTLARRGWKTLGFAVGDDEETAERRFFAEWTKWASAVPYSPPEPEPQVAMPVRSGPPLGPDVIGSFPEPRPEQ